MVPAHTSPHKPGEVDPGGLHRLRMCQLQFAGVERLAVCDLELERGGLSYTVDTLNALHASHPEAELTLLLGADTAISLGGWREPAAILDLARLAVLSRTGTERRPVLAAIAAIDPNSDVSVLQMGPIDVSSSMVRERVGAGEPVQALVGAEVASYIAEHGLYGAERQAPA